MPPKTIVRRKIELAMMEPSRKRQRPVPTLSDSDVDEEIFEEQSENGQETIDNGDIREEDGDENHNRIEFEIGITNRGTHSYWNQGQL